MRHLLACAALLMLVPVAGCGDNLKVEGGPDAQIVDATDPDAVSIDAQPIDAGIDASCPIRTQGMVGGSCTTDAQCNSGAGNDGFCLIGPQGTVTWPAQGFCVNQIDTCTANSCGAGNQCTTIDDPLGAFRACLPACGNNPCVCSDGQICATGFSGSMLGAGQMACLPGNAASIDGSVCVGFGECAQDSLCQSDALEFPGGMCGRIGCTLGDDTTCADGGDGHCVNLGLITSGLNAGTICVDSCAAQSDCRTTDGFRCVNGGAMVGNYCRHTQIGDPCTLVGQCGDPAVWRCSLTLPGGSCTTAAACQTPGSAVGCAAFSSVCWQGLLPVPTDNECVDRCGGPVNTQGGCRTGLTCRDVDPGAGMILGCVSP